jgi:hypothetical protein
MGFGFLFCIPCLVGLILSSISYAKRSSHSLNGFALAGIIVGAVSFVFWLLYISIIGIAFFGFSNF